MTRRGPNGDPYIDYFRRMVAAAAKLTPEQRADLEEWEQKNLGEHGTSDWPGWEALIGVPPWKIK